MADSYEVTGAQDVTTATPGDTAVSLNGVTTTRGRVVEWVSTFGGTPADNAIRLIAQRFTASGTGSAVTPAEDDLDGPAALITVEENHSAEPTYTAAGELFDQIPNQRATFRWVAVPEKAWRIPAASDSGIGWVAFHASYTGSHEMSVGWFE